jgi:hypothetical protein
MMAPFESSEEKKKRNDGLTMRLSVNSDVAVLLLSYFHTISSYVRARKK